ncbi:D-alanine--D-alanine ligase family protein [Chlorobium sp. N1]|uniref:D-alanine--D-alanine ligase family protein n=1 Tax=Chlorobium sp. N1 TaxID=2491138 RepID=UPI0010393A79|nr:D-alanine--D-alanine ligase family protein [Chlorobium sp. N1]TCD48510.1 D-alanine--D-alanine ligase [Chlorobium sp. N1]
MPHTTVALLFGGRSAEHEISVISARAVAAHIDRQRYRVLPIYVARDGDWYAGGVAEEILRLDLSSLIRSSSLESASATLRRMAESSGQAPFNFDFRHIDVAFPVLHGSYGEDGRVQGLLETLQVPFTGCGVLASALTMDKALTKLAARDAGLTVAPSVTVLSREYHADPAAAHRRAQETLTFPMFVKPVSLGSSVGITKVHIEDELPEALAHACSLDTKVLVEEAVKGREVEVAVIGNGEPEASPCGEIEPGGEFYDYEDKYIHDTARLFIPARIPAPLQEEVRQAAITAYRALGCRGMARVDFFVDEGNKSIVFNEVNTIPGFTPVSMYPRLMEAAGTPFTLLTDRLIRLALEPEEGASA